MHRTKQHWQVGGNLVGLISGLLNSRYRSIYAIRSLKFVHRVSHRAKVSVYGVPFIREMPKITGVSGRDLSVKCPVAGHPIDKIHWERGKFFFIFSNLQLLL